MKHALNPDFAPAFPPHYVVPADGVPVIGTRRHLYLFMQVEMDFYAEKPLTVQVHSPTQRGAYTAALVYARRRHTQKRCTELRISFIDVDGEIPETIAAFGTAVPVEPIEPSAIDHAVSIPPPEAIAL